MEEGNAEDFEKTAEQLKTFDKIINKIYQKKTGKSETIIKNLMKENKWLSATEAKEWGFIDSIIKPIKNISRTILNNINQSQLPKLKIKNMEQFDKLNELLGLEMLEGDDTGALLTVEQLKTINDKIVEMEAELTTLKEGATETEEAVTEAKKTADEVTAENVALKATLVTAQAKVEKLKKQAIVPSIENVAPKIDKESIKVNGVNVSPRTLAYLKGKKK
jgi:hypothetical protein